MASPLHRPLCTLCSLYVPGMDPRNTRNKPVCLAFPEGIPNAILLGGFDHREPFSNEVVTFRRASGVTEWDVEEWDKEVLDELKQDMLAMLEHFHRNDAEW